MAKTTVPPWPISFAFPPQLGNSAEIRLLGASIWGFPTRPRGIFFVYSLYLELVQKRNSHFNPNDTMSLPLHGIFPSIVTYALSLPLH